MMSTSSWCRHRRERAGQARGRVARRVVGEWWLGPRGRERGWCREPVRSRRGPPHPLAPERRACRRRGGRSAHRLRARRVCRRWRRANRLRRQGGRRPGHNVLAARAGHGPRARRRRHGQHPAADRPAAHSTSRPAAAASTPPPRSTGDSSTRSPTGDFVRFASSSWRSRYEGVDNGLCVESPRRSAEVSYAAAHIARRSHDDGQRQVLIWVPIGSLCTGTRHNLTDSTRENNQVRRLKATTWTRGTHLWSRLLQVRALPPERQGRCCRPCGDVKSLATGFFRAGCISLAPGFDL